MDQIKADRMKVAPDTVAYAVREQGMVKKMLGTSDTAPGIVEADIVARVSAPADRTVPRPVSPSDRTIPRLAGARDITLHRSASAPNTHLR